jgi:hypothetical protein
VPGDSPYAQEFGAVRRALIGTVGIDQATDRVAFGEKDAGQFGLLGAGRWRFQPKMYLRISMPDNRNYRTYVSPKIDT